MKGFLRKYIRPIFLFICPRIYVSALLAYKKNGKNFDGLRKSFLYNVKKLKLFRGDYNKVISKLFMDISIDVDEKDFFFYSIDVDTYIIPNGVLVDNGTIDYSIFLEHSLKDLISGNEDRNKVIDNIIKYIERLDFQMPNDDLKRNVEYIRNMVNHKAEGLEDALQRILFINQIIWQTGHRLNGFGRLDVILEPFLTDELTDDNILNVIRHFCVTVHKYYKYKSNQLNGDTGQLIILGGYNGKGNEMVHNKLTDLFLQAIADIKLPDPKVLLRVSKETDDDLWLKAVECLKSKTGSPLFSNDDVIIDKLVDFGYEKRDSINYTTSACWEPVPDGCLEQNNLRVLNFLEPFDIIGKELTTFHTLNEIYDKYFELIDYQIMGICKHLSKFKYSYDPLLSLGIDFCRMNDVDVSDGGGKYKNIGVLSVGLANTVNSFLRIESAINDGKLKELQNSIYSDSYSYNSRKENSFGNEDEKVLSITNSIIEHCGNEFGKYRNYYGGKYKFGLSAPDYITAGKKLGATPDGRKNGAPMAVHISADSVVAPTELLSFASKINLSQNAINGNVVDFFLSGSIIAEYTEKCMQLLKGAIKKGIYQMQMNIVDSKTLILARSNPEDFPNLIVRVWGFSAYFNDLPDDYKDYLIERAKACEHAC